ncbi:MAG TPA: cytochrome C oxidase subunit IV family protein [Opitutus sp.]|nr:cytochrome C oxidase subunit IV family protein [Opitutus sp.]
MSAEPKRSTLYFSFVALLALLAAAALVPRLPAGPWLLPLSLGIAVAKLAIIFLFFMHLRYQRGLVRLFAFAGFFWLGLAAALTLSDYLTRGWKIG